MDIMGLMNMPGVSGEIFYQGMFMSPRQRSELLAEATALDGNDFWGSA